MSDQQSPPSPPMPQWAIVKKQIKFSAAHVLPHHAGKCSRLHGHTFVLAASVEGVVQPPGDYSDAGMVCDFGLVGAGLRRLHDRCLDHRYLNDFDDNPTAERCAQRIGALLAGWLDYRRALCGAHDSNVVAPTLRQVELYEEHVEPSCSAVVNLPTVRAVAEPDRMKLCIPSEWGFGTGLDRVLGSTTDAEAKLLRSLVAIRSPATPRVLVSLSELPPSPLWSDPVDIALALLAVMHAARGLDVTVLGTASLHAAVDRVARLANVPDLVQRLHSAHLGERTVGCDFLVCGLRDPDPATVEALYHVPCPVALRAPAWALPADPTRRREGKSSIFALVEGGPAGLPTDSSDVDAEFTERRAQRAEAAERGLLGGSVLLEL